MHRLVLQSSGITKETFVPGDVHFPPVAEGEGGRYPKVALLVSVDHPGYSGTANKLW